MRFFRTLTSRTLIWTSIGLLAAAGCSLVNAPADPEDPEDDDGSGATGNTSTTTSQGGSGGDGGMGPVCDVTKCSGTDTDCRKRACTPDFACTMENEPVGTACSENGGAVCDGNGMCVGCVDDMHCGTSCSNGIQTGQTCDTATNTCDPNVATVPCAPYICGTDSCLTSCSTNADCATNHTCNAAGVCEANCGPITSIATPVNHVNYGTTYGQWMGDPLETLGAGKLWRMESYNTNLLQRFGSLATLIAMSPEQTITLPNIFAGTGAVVNGGFLYYNKTNSPNIIKYDLSSQTQVLDVAIPGAGFMNTYHYQWGGYSDIDLAVDELGLWVIYATTSSGGNIVISKLDPNTLQIQQSWTTTRLKNQSGNAWMACGYLYVTASYSAATTSIDYRYDTATSQAMNPNIPFTNPGTYNSMTDYNPKDKKLYSWDSSQHNTYQVSF